MATTLQHTVKQLLQVVKQQRSMYPKKRFTLGGRLVGDLEETPVEGAYDVELFETQEQHYDAEA